MLNNRFANVCLALMVILLGVIALRRDTVPVFAAKKFTYDVIYVDEDTIATELKKAAQDGWELVATTMYQPVSRGPAGYLIVRK